MSLLLHRNRKPILSPSSYHSGSSPNATPASASPILSSGGGGGGPPPPSSQRWFTMLALPDQPTLARRDLHGFRTRPPQTTSASRAFGNNSGSRTSGDSGYRDSGGSHASILGRRL